MTDAFGVGDVRFGNEDSLPDWRNDTTCEETDPDDDELATTPRDVVALLGFDPKDFSSNGKE